MATEAQNLRRPPFPLSDLGPCELSWFHRTDRLPGWEHWVFWSTFNDELRHHQMPLLLASKYRLLSLKSRKYRLLSLKKKVPITTNHS